MTASLDRSAGYPPGWPSTPLKWQKDYKTWDGQQVEGAPLPPGGSGTTGTLQFTADDAWIYKLNILDSISPNTIQISLPFDQFDASPVEQGSCTKLTCTPTLYNGDPQTVNVDVKNVANYKWGRGYQVREVYYPAGNSVAHRVGNIDYYQNWPSAGFSTDIPAGTTRTSTQTNDPAGHPYFYKPANASVEFILYNDTGPYANVVPWTNGPCIKSGGTVSAVCSPGATPATPSPGVSFSSTYTITVSNTTGATAPGYKLVAVPDGAGVTGATKTRPVSIPTGTHTQSITINITANYAGSYTVTLYDSASPPAVVPNTPCTQPVTPQVTPYFQVWQNDAAAGGAFKVGDGCPSPSTYPAYVSPSTAQAYGEPNPENYGGIRANTGGTYQSVTDFGAVALGLIPNPSGEGFTSISPQQTLFANHGVPAIGGISGYFNSSSANANHCTYDFYDKTQINPTNYTGTLQNAINNCVLTTTIPHRCQYKMSGTQTFNGPTTIPNSTQVTFYVSGDVTINGNITYSPGTFDPTDRTSIPYFTIITYGGDITLTNSTKQLEGLYIAQPDSAVTGGNFMTCDSTSPCPDQLIVNGAVIAQQVELLRAHGTSQSLGGLAAGKIGNAPAEIFSFTPAMILGYPEFSPLPHGNPSLFSLPPVF